MSLGVSGVVYFSRIKNGIMYLDGGASDYKFGRRVNILLKEAQGEAAESSDNCDNIILQFEHSSLGRFTDFRSGSCPCSHQSALNLH